jgi:homoserine dehydrogenase
MINVGIIGLGTVGSAVVDVLETNKELIKARCGKEIVVKKAVVKNINKKRDVNLPISDNLDDILNDKDIDIVVELMGGVEESYEAITKALKSKKGVVTANKALLAYKRQDIQKIAGDIPFGFEASVAGGIPIIKAMRDGLSANHVLSLKGIINGTSNYILTKMMSEPISFEEVLDEAQKLGYAEADPTFDIKGFDAAHKLLILASIAYGIDANPDDILIEGIDFIKEEDIDFAKEFGYAIKHLAIAKRVGSSVELRVHPALVKKSEMLAKVDGVMNGISVHGDKVGELMFYGAGAGGDATASAVVSDIIDIVRNGDRGAAPMFGFKKPLEEGLHLSSVDIHESKYYLRLEVLDMPGVLAKIAKLFGEKNISFETMFQRPASQRGKALLLVSTHKSSEMAINEALKEIEFLDDVTSKPVMIRIEE